MMYTEDVIEKVNFQNNTKYFKGRNILLNIRLHKHYLLISILNTKVEYKTTIKI